MGIKDDEDIVCARTRACVHACVSDCGYRRFCRPRRVGLGLRMSLATQGKLSCTNILFSDIFNAPQVKGHKRHKPDPPGPLEHFRSTGIRDGIEPNGNKSSVQKGLPLEGSLHKAMRAR